MRSTLGVTAFAKERCKEKMRGAVRRGNVDPEVFALVASGALHPNPRRHCPAAVARAVFLRDGQQCSYVSPNGRRCSARRCLELDHVHPWGVGGESTIENLRLRCRTHNQRYERQYFGKSRVEAAVQHARRQRAAVQGPGNPDQS